MADRSSQSWSPSGAALEYSTFLGGTGLEGLQILALDSGGNAYLAVS